MKRIILVIALFAFFLCGCTQKRETTRGFALDTFINITTDKKDTEKSREALRMCRNYEKLLSRTDTESQLYKINEGAALSNEEIKNIIEAAFSLSETSQGAFDITVARLSELWNVKERTVPPSAKEIKEALGKSGYKKVSLSPFYLGEAKLDLGAAAKGYIADRIKEYYIKEGIYNVCADLGGNVFVLGEYTVGIRNPFSPDELYAKITLKDKSAVTSGAYQRYFEYEGKRYHHIINPKTGYPADSGLASVTVISEKSFDADMLSTAIFVLGEQGLSLASDYGADAIIITDSGDFKTTDGFIEKYNFRILK